jgi:hypothetical protein
MFENIYNINVSKILITYCCDDLVSKLKWNFKYWEIILQLINYNIYNKKYCCI